jgi:hypothetical protein
MAALLAGVALVLTSVGTLVTGIITAARSGKVLEKTRAIERHTNGAAAAASTHAQVLQEKIDALQQQLVESLSDRVAAAVIAKQAATDVREAAERPAPPAIDGGDR